MYFLRAKQLGLTLDEMEELDEGIILDMIAEMANDNAPEFYHQMAVQEDFDKF